MRIHFPAAAGLVLVAMAATACSGGSITGSTAGGSGTSGHWGQLGRRRGQPDRLLRQRLLADDRAAGRRGRHRDECTG
jgi:hypothetical protein